MLAILSKFGRLTGNMLFDAIKEELFDRVKAALPADAADQAVLELPPDPRMGDFGFPTFKLAKSMRKAPPVIAKELADKLAADPKISALLDIAPLGPYVNFTVRRDVLVRDVLGSLLTPADKLAEKTPKERPTVIMEFSRPNVAKPFNI